MTEDKYGISPTWEKYKNFRDPFDYTLKESGQTLLLQHLDMGDILKLGFVNELDFLNKAMAGSTQKPESNQQQVIQEAFSKSQNIDKLMAMVDKVCVAGILKPKIHDIPPPDGDGNPGHRQAGLFYVDQIPFDDRQELFGVIFESEGLTDFREEQTPDVGTVADESVVSLPSDDVVADIPTGESESVLSQ